MAQAALLWPRLRPAVLPLGLGLLVLGLLFHAEAASAVHVWNTSTAYGHCWLVVPIALWLAHERRGQAAAEQVAPTFWPAVVGLPLVLAWLAGDTLGIMEGRQLAAVGMLELLFLSAFGWKLWQALAAALLYLVFLVPFGAFLTPLLQNFTAGFVAWGLDFLEIPSQVTSFRIDIPEGTFYVAEACAGLRFLIASIAFGTLYAVTKFNSPWRRAAFIAVSVVIPIVANGFRALGIVVLGHVLGSAQAAATDHILYGWIFFSIVILLLAASGMPFREDPLPAPAPAAPAPRGTTRRAMLAIWPVLLVAAVGPLISLYLNAHPGAAPDAGEVLLVPSGCTVSATQQNGPGLVQGFQCGGSRIVTRLEMLPRRANPARVLGAAQGPADAFLPDTNADGSTVDVDGVTPARWHVERDEDHPAASAYILFIDGTPALGGLHDRLRLARNMLRGVQAAPAALVIAVTHTDADPQQVLRAFLGAQGDIAGRVRALARK